MLPRIERTPLPFDVAVSALQAFAIRPESVDMHVQVSMAEKGAQDKVREPFQGVVLLPHAFRPLKRIAVFAKGAEADAAREAGATYVGDADLVQQVQSGELNNVDIFLSTPDMLKDIKPLGKALRQLMPTQKKGTVSNNMRSLVATFQRGLQFKSSADGNVLAPIGKTNFSKDAIRANAVALLEAVLQFNQTPDAAFVQKVHLATTQGPAFPLDVTSLIPGLQVSTIKRARDKSKAKKKEAAAKPAKKTA